MTTQTPRITLAACRTNTGMSQDQMAEYLGISKYSLLGYEQIPPRTDPPYYIVKEISKISGIPIEFISVPLSNQTSKSLQKGQNNA